MKLEVFEKLYEMDIIKNIEKDYKGLNYLSWATAYKLAMEQDPLMTYEVLTADDGLPFFSRGDIHIIKTKVTMFGETKEMFLPIMDNKHNAVSKPNSRQVGDNIMRCLAKNIAMFGIGLPLYVGEDLKDIVKKEPKKEDTEEARKKGIEMINDFCHTQERIIERDKLIKEDFNKTKIEELTVEELRSLYKVLKVMFTEKKGA